MSLELHIEEQEEFFHGDKGRQEEFQVEKMTKKRIQKISRFSEKEILFNTSVLKDFFKVITNIFMENLRSWSLLCG